jgi:hypothetical protein
MSKFVQAGLVAGAAFVVAAGLSTGAQALDVREVQLGVADLGGSSCPRDAKVTAWAHTDGPGQVKFVIRNDSGGKTGELTANAVKGPTGNFLATYSQTFKITTDTDIKYMAEAIGHGKISNWVSFSAKCGPQVRDSKTTTTTSGKGPKAKHISETDKDRPQVRDSKTTTTSSGPGPKAKHISEIDKDKDGKPANQGKPAGKPADNAGKPINQCKAMLSVTRTLAVTRSGGIATAQVAWQSTAAAAYGAKYGRWSNAKDQSTSCLRKGLTFDCTVKARPCES